MPRITRQTERVLAAFLKDPSVPHYGLELGKAAGLKSGTLYPILARLEAAAWVTSEWEDATASEAGRRPRRYYRLTRDGRRMARMAIRETEAHLRGLLRPETG